MPVDPAQSIKDYRAVASRYDHATRRIIGVRRDAIAALRLQPGETVMDVGCGSGFFFAQILEAIGPSGCLLAFDHSPDLLQIARARIEAAGWQNVVLLEANAETVDFRAHSTPHGAAAPSALLFSYVHDVMQSEAALDNLLAHAAPGARVAITSTKLLPWWGWPVNAYLYVTHRRYITNRGENFRAPWAKLERRLANFEVRVQWPPGWRYVATGTVPA